MLDKSIPFHRIIMRRAAGTEIPDWQPPEGYTFAWFTEGDEAHWGEIEYSVAEVESPEAGAALYMQRYGGFRGEPARRTLFAVNPAGEKVATATLWWNYTGVRRDPWLHWVAVRPEEQGRGLGKAVVSFALRKIIEMEGERDIYLPTQTWSYKAVGIYLKAGFRLVVDEETYGPYQNETGKALPYLRERMNRDPD